MTSDRGSRMDRSATAGWGSMKQVSESQWFLASLSTTRIRTLKLFRLTVTTVFKGGEYLRVQSVKCFASTST